MKILSLIQQPGDNHSYCAGEHPSKPRLHSHWDTCVINGLKCDHAVIQPELFTCPYVMSILNNANDEKHVFLLLECKLYSPGFFFS